ncbi:MAG: transcription termination factor Rho [Clostridia bacterium]|nr:transcription termination factor Rho [Clostridia bacterium]
MISADELKSKPVKELRLIAQSLGMNAEKMKKSEIVSALLSAGEPDPDAPVKGNESASSAGTAGDAAQADQKPQKGRRGRPPGSKNKKKLAEQAASAEALKTGENGSSGEGASFEDGSSGASYGSAEETAENVDNGYGGESAENGEIYRRRPADQEYDRQRGYRNDNYRDRNDRIGGQRRPYNQYQQGGYQQGGYQQGGYQQGGYQQNGRPGPGQRNGWTQQPRDNRGNQQRGRNGYQSDYYQRQNYNYRPNGPGRPQYRQDNGQYRQDNGQYRQENVQYRQDSGQYRQDNGQYRQDRDQDRDQIRVQDIPQDRLQDGAERFPETESYEREINSERDYREDSRDDREYTGDNVFERDEQGNVFDRDGAVPADVQGRDFDRAADDGDGLKYENAQEPADAAADDQSDYVDNRNVIADDPGFDCYGILEINQNGFGFLRAESLYPSQKDIFVAPPIIKKYLMRTGDIICGKAKMQAKTFNAQYALVSVTSINSVPPEKVGKRPNFDTLVPIFPDSQYVLETVPNELSTRIIDMFAPIGKGQRGLIVSPPKAGKTVLLKKIAAAIRTNYPEVHLIILLIDERPEEVTDIRESVDAMVVASTFDEMTSRHIAVSEFCLEHAQRLVEMGSDVIILMDSITRLARAYNQEVPTTGRSLSGGLDPGALYKPKKFFGSARNIKGGGSLTIIATALVDTGSRLDDVIYEEFKGTGNMELHLDRGLAERRVFPSIDIGMSGTRKEELLLSRSDLEKVYSVRRAFSTANNSRDVTESLLLMISKTASNKRFLETIRVPDKTEKTFLPSID